MELPQTCRLWLNLVKRRLPQTIQLAPQCLFGERYSWHRAAGWAGAGLNPGPLLALGDPVWRAGT